MEPETEQPDDVLSEERFVAELRANLARAVAALSGRNVAELEALHHTFAASMGERDAARRMCARVLRQVPGGTVAAPDRWSLSGGDMQKVAEALSVAVDAPAATGSADALDEDDPQRSARDRFVATLRCAGRAKAALTRIACAPDVDPGTFAAAQRALQLLADTPALTDALLSMQPGWFSVLAGLEWRGSS